MYIYITWARTTSRPGAGGGRSNTAACTSHVSEQPGPHPGNISLYTAHHVEQGRAHAGRCAHTRSSKIYPGRKT